MSKESLENFFIETVKNLAKLSKCVSRQVGAILVKDGRIISTGYNGTLAGSCNCSDKFDKNFDRDEHHKWSLKTEIHAEQNVLMMAAKHGIETLGCTVYCSLQPCNTCLLLLIQAGISKIVYIEKYDKSDWGSELLNVIEKNNIKVEQWHQKI